jgi:hypothetical protein
MSVPMNIRVVIFAILCACVMVVSEAQPNSTDWPQFHSEHMMLMQQQAQTLTRLDAVEKHLAEHEASQVGYPATLAIIEFKLDGIKAIFTWVVGLFATIFVGGAGAFWKLITHNRQINNKLDAAVLIASERDVRHTNRERDIQLGQQHNDG